MNRLDEIRERDAAIPDSALDLFAQIRAKGFRLLKNQTATEDRRELLRIIDAAAKVFSDTGVPCTEPSCELPACRALRILRGEE